MLSFDQIVTDEQRLYDYLTLSFDDRVKSRQKVTLDKGEPAGLFLPRGTILNQGDRIKASSGEVVEIKAASEAVSTAYLSDPVLLARACYHLGNRHVALQITSKFIRYQHDHVLDDMLRGLHLTVAFEQAPFEPEAGAYHNPGHGHSHHEH